MLYNVIYIFTFSYGIFQVITGALPLGYLILLQWSYSNLWGIIVHFIGVMVGLVQQRENSKLVNSNFANLGLGTAAAQGRFPKEWDKINLTNISIQIKNQKGLPINIKVPQLSINKRDKIGILGESGSGKSTLLHTLLGLTNYSGKYYIDELDAKELAIKPKNINIINNYEPLFNISIKDNILLGKTVDTDKLDYLMQNLQITRFFKNLDVIIGDKDTHFSSGQLQRLRILRGLLSDSQIYLLDEPFNGIDDENKERIIQFLMGYLKDKTVILVTHNKEELKLVNKNYQFSKNTLVAKN
jgi:ABC-type bacteriocin/lantibiotic exporter with double-glycine peptidase domain